MSRFSAIEDELFGAPPDPTADAARGVPIGLDGEEPPRAVAMSEVDFSSYPQDTEDPIVDPTFCFWCHYAQSREQYEGNNRMEAMVKFNNENRHCMPPFTFVGKMQHLYNTTMRPYMIQNKKRIKGPAWSAKCIWEHSTRHVNSVRSIREEILACNAAIMRQLQDKGIFLSDGTVDEKKVLLFLKIQKETLPLLAKIEGARNPALYGLD